MKKLLVLLLVAAAVTGCCGRNKKNADTAAATENVNPIHNARISLDFIGTYTGVVPITNAPGREITLTLLTDSTFVFDSSVLERGAEFDIKQTSTFSWDESGNFIVLHNLPESITNFKVEENRLRMVDAEFNPIGGDKADKYVLNKVVEPAAEEAPAAE